MAVDAVGTGTIGATNGEIGTGTTVFGTGVPTTPGPQAGAIPTQIGAWNRLDEVGVINRSERRILSVANDPERRPMKTATDRAVEAIEAAEEIFADEMGGTLGLSPPAKIALVATITAAIQAAIAEERQHLTWAL